MLERYARTDIPAISVSLDVLTSVFLRAMVGVLEATLVHALLAEERWRQAPPLAASGGSSLRRRRGAAASRGETG